MRIYSESTQNVYYKLIKASDRQWEVTLRKRVSDSNSTTWNTISADKIQSVTITESAVSDNDITMGCFITSKVEIAFLNLTSTEAAYLTGKSRFRLRFKLTSVGEVSGYAYIDSDEYIVDEPQFKKVRGTSAGEYTYNGKIVAYDLSYVLTGKFESAAASLTGSQIVDGCVTGYGITRDSSVTNALSGTSFEPLADFTQKQTVGFMAGYAGMLAKIAHNGAANNYLYFKWYERARETIDGTTSNTVIDTDRVFDGSAYISELSPRTIAMIETGTAGDVITYPDSAIGFSINFEDPYIAGDSGKTVAQNIYTAKIAGSAISFSTGKYKYKGDLLVGAGSIVTVRDIESQTATLYIMKKTTRYDGGLSETIECVGSSETTSNFSANSPTTRRLERMKSEIEKEIDDAFSQASSIINQTDNSVFEFIDNNGDGKAEGFLMHYIGYNEKYSEEGKSIAGTDGCLVKGSAGGIGLSTDGGTNYGAAMFFYKDNQNVLHGAIDGEYIFAGSIKANSIEAGSITAEQIAANAITVDKLNIGWSGGNYVSSDSSAWRYYLNDNNSYFAIEKDTSSNLPKIRVTRYDSSDIGIAAQCKYFYAAAGSKILYKAKVYLVGNTGSSISFRVRKYDGQSSSFVVNETITQKNSVVTIEGEYDTTDNATYTAYLLFTKCNANSYVTDMFLTQSLPGEMVVHGVIKSTNGKTYFDLDNNALVSSSTRGTETHKTYLFDGAIQFELNNNVLGYAGIIAGVGKSTVGLAYDPSNAQAVSIQAGDDFIVDFSKASISAFSRPVTINNVTTGAWGVVSMDGHINTTDTTFSGLSHTRLIGYSETGGTYTNYGTVKVGVGGSIQQTGDLSAALEVSKGNTTLARIDIIPDWGAAGGVAIKGSGNKGASKFLELGTSDMYWDGSKVITTANFSTSFDSAFNASLQNSLASYDHGIAVYNQNVSARISNTSFVEMTTDAGTTYGATLFIKRSSSHFGWLYIDSNARPCWHAGDGREYTINVTAL